MVVPMFVAMSMGMAVRMVVVVDMAVAMVVRMRVAGVMIVAVPMRHAAIMLVAESGFLTCLQVENSGLGLGAAATGSAHQAASSISISRIFNSSPASRSMAREPQAQAW